MQAFSTLSPITPVPSLQELLTVRDLRVAFGGESRAVQAVDGVSFTMYPRQTVALVGESGCGKSVTALSILRLLPPPPAQVTSGRIDFLPKGNQSQPVNLLGLSGRALRRVRGGEIAMIFQEPMTSLNPVFTIGSQIVEAVVLHQRVNRREAAQVTLEALHEVGITEPARRFGQYPHEFSGGMRQRVVIAMALACRPRLLLADEPTTALDVTVQAQILSLLRSLKASRSMGLLLITHDMGVVAENADVVCVMYAGRVVEYAGVYELFENPLHPYTRGLLGSIPRLGGRRDRLTTVAEVVDNPAEFTRLSGAAAGITPWWPRHQPPQGMVVAGAPATDSVLLEAAPDHWVAVWRTGPAVAQPLRAPALAFQRPES